MAEGRVARGAILAGDTSSGTNGLWTYPHHTWQQPPAGSALAHVSVPLGVDTTGVGGGALQTWIKASVPSVDLQVTGSEVRPDGHETFVQGGWLQASERKLDPTKSTLLAPVPSLRRAESHRCPGGHWTQATVPLYYEGHVYRRASRIRITITAPGGDQPIWAFGSLSPVGRASVSLAFSAQMPSRLILPIVPGIHVGASLPPCPGLRGEPCRAYHPFVNRGA